MPTAHLVSLLHQRHYFYFGLDENIFLKCMDHSLAGYSQAAGECADPLYCHWSSALLSGGGTVLARMPHWPYPAKPILLTS